MSLEIRVIPTREFYFNDDNYFGIYGCDVHKEDEYKIGEKGWEFTKYGNISVKGSIPIRLEMKKEYTLEISPDTKSVYKGNYLIDKIKIVSIGTTVKEQEAFMRTIINKSYVDTIFSAYRDQDVISLIENDGMDIGKLKGIGHKTMQNIKKEIAKHKDINEVLVLMSKFGATKHMINMLLNKYESHELLIKKVTENPYTMTEVRGIGFKRADKIAIDMGIEKESAYRVHSCIRHIIEEENSSGHSWIKKGKLLNRCIELLEIDKKYVEEVLSSELDDIVNHEDKFTLKHVYNTEKLIAKRIMEFKSNSKQLLDTEKIDKFLEKYCKENNVELEKHQRQFFYDFNENNLLALIGGGGMGKSWLVNILIKMLKESNMNVLLLSPTAKAAKVLTAYTGVEAMTIHRRLAKRQEVEITEDIVIVDETSMCDIFIISNLLSNISDNTRLLFIGDDFQIPSVDVGNFLYDIIHSGKVCITRLQKVFRQSDGGILDASTNVREKRYFLNNGQSGRYQFGKDCVFNLIEQENIKEELTKSYKNALKKFSPEDIIVLTPSRKGSLGTYELNKSIQGIVNPTGKEKTFGRDNPVTFRIGDVIMNTANNYDACTVDGRSVPLFNGDQGKIVDIDEKDKVFKIDFDGNVYHIGFDNISSMMHSYVLSIHKMQGSQSKIVIVIIDKSNKFQLDANLIYTAFSRAQQYMLVLGQAETINFSMKKFANMERRSFLREFLMTDSIDGEMAN